MKKIHTFDEVFDSQKIFRLILSAIANPSKIFNIKEFADKLYSPTPQFLAIALTLLDNEVSFNTCENDVLSGDIISLTFSKLTDLQNADYIFVDDPTRLRHVIENAKCGTLRDPHKSATVIVSIDEARDTSIRVFGAGIKDTADLATSPVVLAALEYRDAQFYEYPQGIDLVFVSGNGNILAVPRLTLMEVN